MHKSGVVLAAMALLAACETDPNRFSAPGGASVYGIHANVFEVVAPSSDGSRVFWCAAAEYARRVRGAPWTAEITVARSLGPSEATDRVSAVQFTLNPGAVGITPVRSPFPNQFELGDTFTVSQGNFECDKLRLRVL